MRGLVFVFSMALGMGSLPSFAVGQEVGAADSNYADGILVTTKDVTTCPYHVIDSLHASASIEFSSINQASLFAKLRGKAKAIGADAVILVTASNARMSAFSFSKRDAIGRAIQYVDKACAPKT